MGREEARPQKQVNDYIESLAIEKSSVGFCNALLERVRSFQSEH
jgi:hypothetical protein